MAMPKPAVNPLEDLFQLISRGEFQKEIEYRGKKYLFRSLCDEDYTWRDQYVNMSGPVAYAASQRSPTLSIACVAIDGVPVEQMDDLNAEGSGIPQAARDLIRANEKFLIAHNLHEKVFSKLPRDYIVGLYSLFLEQVEKASRVIEVEDVKN
jgi:hypothetical protein